MSLAWWIPPTATISIYRDGVLELAEYDASAAVQVRNEAVLTHRYDFNTDGDASGPVGGANGTLQGTATVSSGRLQLTGVNSDYLDLPPGLLTNYDSVTIDAWVNSGAAQSWARLWEFADLGAATQNEFYFAPGWNPTPNALLSTSASVGASLSGGNLVLSWPVAAAGFSVQARSSVIGGNWLTLTNTPTLVGNTTWQMTLPLAGGAQFVRLWR